MVADFDLSSKKKMVNATIKLEPIAMGLNNYGGKTKLFQSLCVIETTATTDSFVGTEEYLAPEIISLCQHSFTVDWWALGVLLYELSLGKTPFRSVSRYLTFNNINVHKISFPPHPKITMMFLDILTQLSIKCHTNRLGSLNGSYDIFEHLSYQKSCWSLTRDGKPPYVVFREFK